MSTDSTSTTDAADPRFAGLPGRPGKIIAVHLSYASRADQRGRRPASPSYFFKPSSSVAASGASIERPAGTELLAFEGEIAVVIGTAARRVPLETAWDHVGWVTAANDFGVYDLRANDKGSNVRSKGGDGYTPIGAHLIDARTVDPAALRLRTWVNGALVQDDTSAGLIFPLAQFVADLSQHFTLEPGDVILTGTPAGSSVVVPGDVVEVELDAPTAPGAPTSGRLLTTVVQGADGFDAAIGSLPAVDDAQRADAWGTRAAAGLADPQPALSAQLRAKLERAPVAGLSAQLRKRGLNNVAIDGLVPMHPDAKLIGTAKTLRFVPNREDLFRAHGGGYNPQKQAFDAVGPGEVIVIEARGDAGAGTLGDILAIRAHAAGAAGIVTDGAVRDYDAVAAVGIPVFSQGSHPAVLGRKHVAWDHDLTVACGGATVQPGDVIVGDSDGVIVIPTAMVEEVVDAALAQEDEDGWVAAQVAAGHRIDGLFPMNAQWRARYEAEHAREDR
nr:fumarylacetoacetate hydrolase family protein [Microbacterium bovistercoris]